MTDDSTLILDAELLAERASRLESTGHNGFTLAYVTLDASEPPLFATLDVKFVNAQALATVPPRQAFVVEGGVRRNRQNVQVTAVAAIPGQANSLRLTLEPIGDYSTYTLTSTFNGVAAPGDALPRAMDPIFNRLHFKFRPGCFNLACAPAGASAPPEDLAPAIDYLARDYESFRHVLMTAMAARVKGWAPTSEADLDQVLIDLVAARGDEIADSHDRVMAERGMGTARKRVSLARHARLVDYHLHQGQQAVTTLVVEALTGPPTELPAATAPTWTVSTGPTDSEGAVAFATFADRRQWRRLAFPDLNRLRLYSWSGAVVALLAGSTSADLVIADTGAATQARALRIRDLLLGVAVEQAGAAADLDASVNALLLAEMLNPETGTSNGHRLQRRQRLTLLNGPARAQALQDPVTGDWFCRVGWRAVDALAQPYCFSVSCGGVAKDDVSLFFGNLAEIAHGSPRQTSFVAEGAQLPADLSLAGVATDSARWTLRTRPLGAALIACGAEARLPRNPSIGPLAYQATPADGSRPARSTLVVDVISAGSTRRWSGQIDLIESQGSDEHFVVETDEGQFSTLRFGDGVNGAPLPEDAVVICRYQSGQGEAGNVGANRLRLSSVTVGAVWNPFDVSGGL